MFDAILTLWILDPEIWLEMHLDSNDCKKKLHFDCWFKSNAILLYKSGPDLSDDYHVMVEQTQVDSNNHNGGKYFEQC